MLPVVLLWQLTNSSDAASSCTHGFIGCTAQGSSWSAFSQQQRCRCDASRKRVSTVTAVADLQAGRLGRLHSSSASEESASHSPVNAAALV